jgi:uncharacterized protein (DUF362 family)
MMNRVTRRHFLKQGMSIGCAFGGGHLLAGCGATRPAAPLVPETPYSEPAKVAVTRGRDLVTMVHSALDAIGGIDSIVHEGETVFIKPNFGGVGMVSHDTVRAGDSTKPDVVIAVAEECLRVGAGEVIIGEGAQVPKFSWDDLTTLGSSATMTAEAARLNASYSGKVTLSCLSGESPSWVAVPSPYTGLGTIKVSGHVTRADRVISIPVIKTHRWTQVTASMKNFVGVTSVDQYGGMQFRSELHNSPGGIEQCFLDIVAAVKPDLAIIDASICCEGDGPHVLPGWWGDTVDMRDLLGDWLILASTDLAAADATAARVIGHDVAEVEHLKKAYNQGIGQIREDMIEIIGASLDSVGVNFKPATPTDGFLDVILPGIMLTTE